MGGNRDYDHDVAQAARSIEREYFQPVTREAVKSFKISKLLNPKKLIRECLDDENHPKTTPIVIIMDVTLSRSKDIGIIFGKLPMLMGQIVLRDYVPTPEISFAAVGDATAGDEFPIQIGEFEADNRLDDSLQAIILEHGGGGGTGQESYQLMAYFYGNYSKLDCNSRGQKGYCFFIGDEGFYPTISKKEVKAIFGVDIPSDLDSAEAFKKLQEKYNVFFIYPQKSWEERKQGIDDEIRQRVEKAGGLYEGVDVRASLKWDNLNDEDLHCITPTGEHVYYSHKVTDDGKGSLDVDKNIHHDEPKPVENIRWAKGKAEKGKYRFFVETFSFDPGYEQKETPISVEVEINGEIQRIDLTMPAYKTKENSRVEVGTFEFDPSKRKAKESDYSGYDDRLIKGQWESVIPKENVITIVTPKAVVDTLLGVLALTNNRTLDEYITDMANRDQTQTRQQEVRNSLTNFAISCVSEKINLEGLSQTNSAKRTTGTKRI